MLFNINDSIVILERTPMVLETLLTGLNEKWITNNEGGDTWSPFDVLGHLIHGEKTDWIPRMMIILDEKDNKKFTPFDRFAQFKESKGKTLGDLLEEFKMLRRKNLAILKEIKITEEMLNLKGIHPEFGEVTLQQLLATWVVHDLGHLCQTTRVMAKQYKQEIGPWTKYFSIFNKG
jgi:DinB superfamily